MAQTDLIARVGLVIGSSFFILPICIASPRSGSIYFPGQYTLFIENFMFWIFCWYAAWEKKKNPSSFLGWAIPLLKVNMLTNPAHFYETRHPSKQVKKFHIIRNCKIRWIVYEINQLFYWGKPPPGGSPCLI